jgi:hypothetical protein
MLSNVRVIARFVSGRFSGRNNPDVIVGAANTMADHQKARAGTHSQEHKPIFAIGVGFVKEFDGKVIVKNALGFVE